MIKVLLQSKKFWITLIGGAMTACSALFAKYGLEVSDAAVQQVATTVTVLFTVLLGAQGLADHGKEKAKIETGVLSPPSPTPAPVVTTTQLSLLLILALAVTVTQPACDTLKNSGTRTATSAIDCLQPSLIKTGVELKPTYQALLRAATGGDGKIDWGQIRPAVSSLKEPALRCAFSAVVSEAMHAVRNAVSGVMSSPLEVDKADLTSGYEAIRKDFFSGETYKLEGGTL